MILKGNKKALAVVIVIVALIVFVLPAFVAFRYTAPEQRGEFITHPWRGWGFAYAALAVPGDAQLKTSGMALRKADWIFRDSSIDPREVQLLFVPKRQPYAFGTTLAGHAYTTRVTPHYRFIWQVEGVVDGLPGNGLVVVALLDYATGRLLYDVRSDLPPQYQQVAPEATPEATSTPTSTGTPAPTSTPTPTAQP